MVIFVTMIFLELQNASFIPGEIKRLDYILFAKVNGEWHNSFFDTFLPFIREPLFWTPFYFFLVMFSVLNFKGRGWLWVLFLILNAVLSDFVSSTLIKEHFWRLRPCQDPALSDTIRFLVSYCPRSSSFTSSHAANHFAAAMFIFTTYKNVLSSKWALIFIWAFAISYAQVYVGVHFPVDIFCGAIAGLVTGYLPARVFNYRFGLEKIN